jgi:methylase of polypeptide subunit release factors
MPELKFADQVLTSFRKLKEEISLNASEYDVRHRIIKYIVEQLLGYDGKDYEAEKNRTDIRLLDENHSSVLVVIETKQPAVNINEQKWVDQAFSYSDSFTKFIVLTNGLHLKIWESHKKDNPIVNLDFASILNFKRFSDSNLSLLEKSQILSIWSLSKENLWSEAKYSDFHVCEKIDISSSEGFEKLIEKLNFVLSQLQGYAFGAFNRYADSYERYKIQLDKIISEQKKVKGNKDFEVEYERAKKNLENSNLKYIDFFSGYEQWLKFSNREDNEESKDIFCRETVYVLLNKILLIRICEDKKIITKKISNSGVDLWKHFVAYIGDSYKDLLNLAYKDISQLYGHIYERGIFDWYDSGNGDLNRVLNLVLYVFNHFNFASVDRDILGKVYEKYLPIEERRKLGEFYTPDQIIDHILDQVGYTIDSEIEGKDVLDPACGSGSFLVKAINRLIKRYETKGLSSKVILKNAIGHIYGFDINPFACHIAEMNLLFQCIDLYVKAKSEDADFKLPRFNIYQTNSLELPSNQKILWQYTDYLVTNFLEEKDHINQLKTKKFDFVIGNPPYVPVQRLPLEFVDYLKKNYKTPFKRMDLYVPFMERGLSMLNSDGIFGIIVSDQFLNATYGEKLRKFITDNFALRYILDFRDVPVFPELTNYPLILVLSKQKIDTEFKCVICKSPKIDLIEEIKKNLAKKSVDNENFSLFTLKQSDLASKKGKPWVLLQEDKERIFEKIRRHSNCTLGQVSKIRYGSISGADTILVVRKVKQIDSKHWEVQPIEPTLSSLKIEISILRPYVKGKDLKKWKIGDLEFFIIYPYIIKEGKVNTYSETELEKQFPYAYQYLLSNKNFLENRKDSRGTMKKLGRVWYSWVRLGDPEIYASKKIITPYLTDKCKFAIDEANTPTVYASSVYGITSQEIDLKILVGLLNSKITEFCMKTIAPVKAGGFGLWRGTYLDRIPIKRASSSQDKTMYKKILEIVNEILGLSEKIDDAKKYNRFEELVKEVETLKLDDYPSVIFSINSNNLTEIRRNGNRIYLNLVDYIDFNNELLAVYVEKVLDTNFEKLVKCQALKQELYQINVPKKIEDLANILNTFESKNKELNLIPQKMDQLQDDINQIVYTLYNLSEEDIKLIEKWS